MTDNDFQERRALAAEVLEIRKPPWKTLIAGVLVLWLAPSIGFLAIWPDAELFGAWGSILLVIVLVEVGVWRVGRTVADLVKLDR